jgi:hypothetical protein
MSIDLSARINCPIGLRSYLPKMAAVLQQILGTVEIPTLTLNVLDEGRRAPAQSDEMRDLGSPFFLISIEGEPETVGVLSDGEFVTTTMAAQRTRLEYALGAAVIIALTQEMNSSIEDPWKFFGPRSEQSSQEMLDSLRMKSQCVSKVSLSEAADRLVFESDRRWGRTE